MTPSGVLACWKDVPLKTIIKKSPVIVIGEITRIKSAKPPFSEDEQKFDTAFITVTEVLKNDLPKYNIKVGDKLPLSMPSAKNVVKCSTDLIYELGIKGIWIIDYRDKSFWATYPKDFQRMEEEKNIRKILQNNKD